MKKNVCTIIIFLSVVLLTALFFLPKNKKPEKIKVLIVPKFEIGELSGDFPGEAQYYFEHYMVGADKYEVTAAVNDNKLYVKDGVALYATGMGKANAAISMMSILQDGRFDFSDAYILSVGCCGAAYGYAVVGDTILVSGIADDELGHTVDSAEFETDREATWYRDARFDDSAYKILDTKTYEQVYALVRDIEMVNVKYCKEMMRRNYLGEQWALRVPKVIRGSEVSGDDYWKGKQGHIDALFIVESYGLPDPFASVDMEDIAIAQTADRIGMLDRLIIIRTAVNMDVFVDGLTPEMQWGENPVPNDEDSMQSSEIFSAGMANNFRVGKVIIDAILNGELDK